MIITKILLRLKKNIDSETKDIMIIWFNVIIKIVSINGFILIELA